MTLDGVSDGRIECLLRNAGHECALSWYAPFTWLLPATLPMGLYDLHVSDGARQGTAPNSVCVRRRTGSGFTVAHVTDPHLGSMTPDGDTTRNVQSAERLVRYLNDLAPDFVCLTGDLISRYGPDKAPLPAAVIHQAARRAREVLGQLRVPVFVTRGNHDVAFPASRAAWLEYMGGPAAGPDDYTFDYNSVRFVFLDAFVHYDPDTGAVLRRGHTPQQIEWLRTCMARPGVNQRVLVTHNDVRNRLTELATELALAAILYGHTGRPRWEGSTVAEGTLNGHTPPHQCRLLRFDHGHMQTEVTNWREV